MKLALVILVVALVALTWRLHSVNATLGEQQQQIQTLNWTRTQQCAVQADKLVSRFRLDEYPDSLTLNSRRNHYSTTDGRCYVLLERDRAPNAFKYRREM